MRCDLPIISTDCPSGPREIIAPKTDVNKKLKDSYEVSDYGILVSVDNDIVLSKAMDVLLKDDAMQKVLEDRSEQRAKEYSSVVVVDKFIDEILEN